MANRLFGITIGDSLFIQLSANPATDGIGYSAPLGSFAYHQGSGSAFVKVGAGNTDWHTISRSFQNGGDTFDGDILPDLVLGSLNNKNLRFIRNNISVQEFLISANPNFSPDVVRLPEAQFEMAFNINDNSSVLSNEYLVEPLQDNQRASITLHAQGMTVSKNSQGHMDVQERTSNSDALDTFTKRKRKVSASRENIPFAGPISIPTIEMEADAGRVMITEVTVLIRNVATNEVSQRKETFTIKATNFALGQYSVIFNANEYQYFENALDDMILSLTLINEPLSNQNQATNTYRNVVTISNLQVGQNYDILVWQERLGMA